MKRLLFLVFVFVATLPIQAVDPTVTINGVVYEYNFTYTIHEESAPGVNTYSFSGWAKVKDGKDAEGDVELVPSISVVVDEATGHTESINVSQIIPYAFSGNTMIRSVVIPDGMSFGGIGGNHFSGCTNLVSVSLPGGISIPYHCFWGCTNLANVTLRGAINGIGEDAFRSCTSLKSIDLSKGVKELDRSFYLCSSLESVIFPQTGLTKIGSSCFASTALKTINVPASVTFIGTTFCGNCTELTEAVIQGGVYSSSEQSLFKNCTKLKTATITWTGELARYMFTGCSSLETVNLNSGITAIGWGAFGGCTSLKALTLPNTVTSIKGDAFSGCSSLESIVMPNGVAEIGSSAFKNCTSLDNVTVPSGVTDLSNNAFEGCSSLEIVSLPSSMTRIGNGAFKGCTKLALLGLPSSLITIDHNAFYGCASLNGLNLPAKLETVNTYAFANCTSLQSLTFPASMKTLGNYAFSKTTSMELIDLRASTQLNITSTERTGVFGGVPETTVILLPGSTPPTDTKEPYAVLSSDNKTLTFYYDENKEVNGGMGVGPFTYNNGVNSGWFNNRLSINTVVFDDSFAYYHDLTSTAYWFVDFYQLTTITGIENLNTENVTSMEEMFYNCAALQSLDVSHFDTGNVEDMGYMFYNCSYLISLDVTNFNTPKVTDMYGMFEACLRLESIDLSNFDTRNVTNLSNMFYNCLALTTIYVGENWNTGSVISSDYMFNKSTKLVGGKGTVYDAAHTDYTYAHIDGGASNPGYFTAKGQTDSDDDIINFADAEVKRICVANWDTSGDGEISYKEAKAVTNLDRKFANNALITSFDELQYFTGLKALNYQEGGQFELCENLESIILPNSLEKIGEATFNYCRALKGITIPASVTEMSYLGGWYYGMTTITVAAGNSVYDSRNNCNAVIETATNKLISGCNSTVIPNTVTAIGPFAFNACVTDPIAIPTSVTTIGRAAFSTCQFTEVTLPSSIKSIDISFAGCSQIKIVVSKIIEPFAIENATFDQTVYNNATLWVPTDDAVSKYKDADGWKNFKDIRSSMIIVVMDDKDDQQDYFKSECKYNDDNSLEIVNVDEASGDVEIPSAIVVDNNQIAVTSIADGAFANSSITSVTIPATITSIGDGAFSGCNNLEYVDLSNASGLVGLTVDEVNRDGNGAFAGLSEGTVIVLPSSVSTTMAQAFSTAEPNIVYRDGSDYKSENVSLADKATFSVPASVTEVKVANVSYGRTFNRNDVVYSICLPYDQPLAEGLKAYELDEFNNGSLVFKETDGAVISAGKPYLITTSQSVDGMSANNVTMYIGGNGNDKVVTDYTFCGTLKTITNEDASQKGYLIMQSDKLWHPVPANNAAVNIPAGRAYLKPNNSNARAIKRTVLKDNDEVTYIKTIDYDGTATYYDLNGHRIGEPVKAGVYVKDGNKVVVK